MHDAPARVRRRWLKFSLRTVFVLVTLFGIWLGLHVQATRRQEHSVAAIRDIGGWCYYDFQVTGTKRPNYAASSSLPAWLVDWLGVDFFHDVVEANLDYHYDASGRHENSSGTGDDLKHLVGFPKLRWLGMHEDQASDAGLAYVGQLTQLEELFIWDAREITDTGVAHLKPLLNLRYLHLSYAKIGDDALQTLAQMPSLEGLSLQGNHFTNAGLKHLQDDVKLKKLYIGLGELDVDDEGLAHLAKLVNLEALDLQRAAVHGPGLRHLRGMQRLKQVWLSTAEIHASDLAEFRQDHPACRMMR